MTDWIYVFGAITVVAAGTATFVGDVRLAILALWVSGLGAAGLFLSAGSELVAIIQLVVSTLSALAAVFYAISFGEYGKKDERPLSRRVVTAIAPVLVGAGFGVVIWIGTHGLVPAAEARPRGHDIVGIGKALLGEHFLPLEILALTLLMTIVGAGVVGRDDP